MRKITGNTGRLASRSLVAGLVLLLVLAGWPPTAAEAQMTQLDWSKVQAVKPGTPIKVVLHKDRGPRGDRKLRGRFQSATDDSITLTLKDGQRHTFSKWAVRKVLTRRPIWGRYQGWITAIISTTGAGIAGAQSVSKGSVPTALFYASLITGLGFLVAPKMGGIYNVPRKHRMQPPADKPSGAQSKASEKQKQP